METAQKAIADVEKALSVVIDPETGLSVTRMDLIHDLRVEADMTVGLVFRPSSPECPMAYALANSIKRSILGLDWVNSVTIKVENYTRADHLESIINK
jgi:metal-sulfur cluster biosynthetic enzyme